MELLMTFSFFFLTFFFFIHICAFQIFCNYFIYLFLILLIFFGCAGYLLLCRLFFSCREWGLLSCRGFQASHCGGFSCCVTRALGKWPSVAVASGLCSMGFVAPQHVGSSQIGDQTCISCIQETEETQVQSLGQGDPLEEEMAIQSSILAWRIP